MLWRKINKSYLMSVLRNKLRSLEREVPQVMERKPVSLQHLARKTVLLEDQF